jgi:uncharacterized protein YkwD
VQPEPTPARRPVLAWITAALGIALVAFAAATMVGTVFLSSSSTGTGSAAGASSTVDSPSDASPVRSLSPSVSPSTGVPVASTAPTPVATKAQPLAKAPPTTKPPTKAPAAAQNLTGEAAHEAAVLNLVNQERAKAGCNALTADSRLAKAAKAHSADMAARNYFDHSTPEGVTADTRVTSAGYRWSAVGENIAMGQKDPASVMAAWMNSAGHRANILNCDYRNLGVGLAYNASNTPYWTQDFGTPA